MRAWRSTLRCSSCKLEIAHHTCQRSHALPPRPYALCPMPIPSGVHMYVQPRCCFAIIQTQTCFYILIHQTQYRQLLTNGRGPWTTRGSPLHHLTMFVRHGTSNTLISPHLVRSTRAAVTTSAACRPAPVGRHVAVQRSGGSTAVAAAVSMGEVGSGRATSLGPPLGSGHRSRWTPQVTHVSRWQMQPALSDQTLCNWLE